MRNGRTKIGFEKKITNNTKCEGKNWVREIGTNIRRENPASRSRPRELRCMASMSVDLGTVCSMRSATPNQQWTRKHGLVASRALHATGWKLASKHTHVHIWDPL